MGDRKGAYRDWWGILKVRAHLEDLGDERILVKRILKEIGWDGVNWIDLAQDKDKCRAFLNAKMRLRVPQNAVHFLTKKRLGLEGLCSMEVRSEEMKNPLRKCSDVKAQIFC